MSSSKAFARRRMALSPLADSGLLLPNSSTTRQISSSLPPNPFSNPPTFRTPVFIKTVVFPTVGAITYVMASRIEDALEPVFREYTAHHEIPDVQIQQQPPSPSRPSKPNRKTSASVSEPEQPRQKRVKALARKKGGDVVSPQKKKKTKKASKPMTPPRNESSDSEETLSGHGAERTHSEGPTYVEVESHHVEEVHAQQSHSSVPPRLSQSTGPSAPSSGGSRSSLLPPRWSQSTDQSPLLPLVPQMIFPGCSLKWKPTLLNFPI